ncbi:MAG TPA: hypothetical protein VMX13_06880 [Sedimentisphaerales bacterium]|nr:hypothetical protein [Sedimentisphaerales bacterium]
MAELHFRQPPTITQPRKAAFLPQDAHIGACFAAHNNGETGPRCVDTLFWEFSGKNAGQEKNTAKYFAIFLHGLYTNVGQKTRNGSKVSTKGGKK